MDDKEAKRLRKLERNRDSARESRKRKKDRIEFLADKLARLESENQQLRLKLVAQEDTTDFDNIDLSNLNTLLKEEKEDEIADFLSELKDKYSDYGKDRQSAISFHIDGLRKSLKLSSSTLVVMWMLELSRQYKDLDGPILDRLTGVTKEMWGEVMNIVHDKKVCSLEESERNFFNFLTRCEIAGLRETSKNADDIFNRLEALVENRNESLESELTYIQSLFNVKQITKFILWIDKNPACMQMLDALWPYFSATISSAAASSSSNQAQGPSSMFMPMASTGIFGSEASSGSSSNKSGAVAEESSLLTSLGTAFLSPRLFIPGLTNTSK